MKQLNLIRNLFSVAVMMTLACNVSAQVSIRDRIQIMDRDIFNYPESTEAPVKIKKSTFYCYKCYYYTRNYYMPYE